MTCNAEFSPCPKPKSLCSNSVSALYRRDEGGFQLTGQFLISNQNLIGLYKLSIGKRELIFTKAS